MKHFISKTHNGIDVYVDLISSAAANSIARQPQLITLIKEVVALHTATEATVVLEYTMGRDIGYSYIVPTSSSDAIFYARPFADPLYSRFVKRAQPRPTSHLTVELQQDQQGHYALTEVWIGKRHPPRPGSVHETADSKQFWLSHAFVLDNQRLQAKTITTTCPY